MKKHEKISPEIKQFRDYNKFDSIWFLKKFQMGLTNLDMNNLDSAKVIAPPKTKFLRANHSKFVTEEAGQAIMLKTKLRNQFWKKGL